MIKTFGSFYIVNNLKVKFLAESYLPPFRYFGGKYPFVVL